MIIFVMRARNLITISGTLINADNKLTYFILFLLEENKSYYLKLMYLFLLTYPNRVALKLH